MGMGEARGLNRSVEAAKKAIHSPLLENLSIDGAKGLLVNIGGNKSITLHEVKSAMDYIKNAASPNAHVFYGQVFDDALEDRFFVTVIATGFPPARRTTVIRRVGREGADARRAAPRSPAPLELPAAADDLRRPAYLRRKLRKLS